MSTSHFTLSTFGDEIAPDLETQLQLLNTLKVNYLEFRSAWGVNVKDLDDDQLSRARQLCDDYGVQVSCIGSPIGKSPIDQPLAEVEAVLRRILEVCDKMGTRFVRMFSFYPPEGADFDAYVGQSVERLSRLAGLAAEAGVTLVMENDLELVGDNLGRCKAIFEGVNSPALRHAWDSGNFVLAGVAQPTTDGWPLLSDYLGYVHIKDARAADHTWRAAGEGQGQIDALLRQLAAVGYRGFLAVEPHPFVAADGRTLSAAEGTTYAVAALRKLLAENDLSEQPQAPAHP